MKTVHSLLLSLLLVLAPGTMSAESWDYQHSPEKVSNLALHFPSGALTGSVSFTLPTTTVANDDLVGSVEYAIVSNNTDTLATGKGNPGADVLVDNITLQRGYPNITVYSGYQGKWASFYTYASGYFIGYDSPKAVKKVSLNYDKTKKVMNLSWDAVETGERSGEHSGFVNADSVKYLVSQIAGTDTVALDAVTATTYDVDLSSFTGETVSYIIMPVNSLYAGPSTVSDEYAFNAIVPPYDQAFGTTDEFNTMTVVQNGSSSSYKWYRTSSGYAQYNSSWSSNNCWLVTPAIKLDKGNLYQLSDLQKITW